MFGVGWTMVLGLDTLIAELYSSDCTIVFKKNGISGRLLRSFSDPDVLFEAKFSVSIYIF